MKLNGIELKDLPIRINYGIIAGNNDAFYIDEEMILFFAITFAAFTEVNDALKFNRGLAR